MVACTITSAIACSLGFSVVGGVAGLVAWTCGYDLLLLSLRCRSEWLRTPPPGEEEDRAVLICAMVQQLIVCPTLTLLLIMLACNSIGLVAFWRGSWQLADSYRVLAVIARHAHYSTFGSALKDCFSQMALAFWVHHLATFAGLGMCLFVDAGTGLVTIVGLVAETGSGTYNLVLLYPTSRPAYAVYLLTMNASNVFATCCLVEVINGLPALATGYRIAWSSLCILLLLLRTGGVALAVRKYCSAAPEPPAKTREAATVAVAETPVTSERL